MPAVLMEFKLHTVSEILKRHNQAKIIKKSVFLFWLLNMCRGCEQIHRLELCKFFQLCAHLPVKGGIKT